MRNRKRLFPADWHRPIFRATASCSTLFSIKDQITRAYGFQCIASSVLNAFQHQRSNHFGLEEELLLVECAQRFSASKIKSQMRAQLIYGYPLSAQRFSASKIKSQLQASLLIQSHMRAQRFSASKIKSLQEEKKGQSYPYVLNAFQHQRSNHILSHPGQQDSSYVLNAFKHQRSNHSGASALANNSVCQHDFKHFPTSNKF